MPSAADLLAWLTDHAVLLLAASVTLTIAGEHVSGWIRRRPDPSGSATSLAAGAAYLVGKGIVAKGLMLGVALAVYEHRLFDLDPLNPVVWLAVFVGRDFVYYWTHRAEHGVRVLWASHMVHHSLERFTFTSAVRLPWMEAIYKPVIALWVPLLGFHPVAFAAMGALVLMAGQLQHTELVRRRTVLDRVFVTPAAHRVHHGSNPEYLDKNFGSMLIESAVRHLRGRDGAGALRPGRREAHHHPGPGPKPESTDRHPATRVDHPRKMPSDLGQWRLRHRPRTPSRRAPSRCDHLTASTAWP